MDNTYVYIVRLPDQVNEIVLPCADGYTIYVNEMLDETGRLEAYRHAVDHIKNNDWNKSDVQHIETIAHRR